MSLDIRIREHGDEAGGLERPPSDVVLDQGCAERRVMRVFGSSMLDRPLPLHHTLADALAPVSLRAAS